MNASSSSTSSAVTSTAWTLSNILFGDDDNTTSNSGSGNSGASGSSNNNNRIISNPNTPVRSSVASTKDSYSGSKSNTANASTLSSSSEGGGIVAPPPSNQWSHKPGDGIVPDLQWSNLSTPNRKPIFSASQRLRRHMHVCETMLMEMFPDLSIDLSHPFGTTCPGRNCNLKRPLSIGELYRGWVVGDPNKYTTKCFHCGCEFVPRFCVTCSASDWEGSEGPGTPLWCELLSPWTLRKEVFNVLFDDGIETLLDKEFRTSSAHHAVVFWNAIIAFRLRGLPYSFLLCDNSITSSFPPHAPKA